MKKITEGYGRTSVLLTTLRLDSGLYKSDKPFLANIRYYFEDYIDATADEPECPEVFNIAEMSVSEPVRLTSKDSYHTVFVGDDVNLILSERGVEDIITEIKKQCRGSLNDAPRYIDPDSQRPEINDRIRSELGWGLLSLKD